MVSSASDDDQLIIWSLPSEKDHQDRILDHSEKLLQGYKAKYTFAFITARKYLLLFRAAMMESSNLGRLPAIN